MGLNFIKESITLGADKITNKTFTFFKQGFRIKGAIGEPEYRDVTVSGVDSLTLPNAKADGLNYCKLYGKCEQRNLPEEYTEVEYLQSSGTQWIDTGYKPSANIKFEISGTQSDSDSALFGISELFFCFDNGNATFYNFFGGSVGSFSATLKNVPIVLTMSASNGIVINGTKYVSLTAGSATAKYSMALFGRRNNSTGAIDKRGNHIIKYAKIYESNILIHNYIPCRRNSDSVLGMYDTVTNTFLTNAGTGTFIAGNDVVPAPTQPINIICNNGVIKVSPNLFDKNSQYIAGFVNSETGILSASTEQAQQRSFVIPCLPNTTYVLQGMTANSTWGSFTSSTIGTRATSYVSGNTTLTTGSNDKYLIGLTYTASGLDYRNTLQIEAGTTATAYMPYKQVYTDGTIETIKDSLNNTATAENLLSVGTYKDFQSVIDGGVTRNVGIKVLDGTEDWSLTGTSFRFDGNIKFVQPNTCLCTHFKGWLSSVSITDMPDLSIKAGHPTNTYRVYARYDKFTTVEQLKSWLAQQYANGTPVIVVYPLATPTTSTVTAQTLTTKKGTNTIEITQASLTGLPIEVNYMAGVSVTVQQIENANLDNQVTVTSGG